MIRNLSKARTLLVLIALAVPVISATGCRDSQGVEANGPKEVVRTAVVQVDSATVPDRFEAVGTVRAAQTTLLSAQVMGRILAYKALEGDRIGKDTVVAVLDDAPYQASVAQAQAGLAAARQTVATAESQLELAASTLRRFEILQEKNSVSPQEFDEVKARHRAAVSSLEMSRAARQQAEAALEAAQTQLSFTRIRAPFDARVTTKHAEIGDLATPGAPLLTIESSGRLRLEVTVNESEIDAVRLGESVPVVWDSDGDGETKGQVVQILPAADPSSRSVLVKIELPSQPSSRSGRFGRALFSRGERTALLVPVSAVVDRGQLLSVYVLDDTDSAQLRYITVGKKFGENLEVLSGLQEGETVVARPGARELSGARIEAGER